MKVFKHKEKKHLETSKKVLRYALGIETILLIVITIGWFNNLQEAYQWFFGDIAFFIATVVGYFGMCIFINPAKIKCGANILPDILTLLGAMFNALSSGDIPSAFNAIISACQMIIQSHPELSQSNIPQQIQDYQLNQIGEKIDNTNKNTNQNNNTNIIQPNISDK